MAYCYCACSLAHPGTRGCTREAAATVPGRPEEAGFPGPGSVGTRPVCLPCAAARGELLLPFPDMPAAGD